MTDRDKPDTDQDPLAAMSTPTHAVQDAALNLDAWRERLHDQAVIDGAIDGSARLVGGISGVVRQLQTGHLYQYALVMLLGILGLLTWQPWPYFRGLLG